MPLFRNSQSLGCTLRLPSSPYPTQPVLPSIRNLDSHRKVNLAMQIFSNIRQSAGGTSERGRPQVWTLAWRWILPKDALKLISTLLTEHKQSEDKIFSYVNECFFSVFEEYRILVRCFATNGEGKSISGRASNHFLIYAEILQSQSPIAISCQKT